MMKEHVDNFEERRPFFPGQSCFPLSPCKKSKQQSGYPNEATDQLNMIFDVIGTPQPSDLGHIRDKRVLYYLSTFSRKPKKDLKTVFPAASEEALDLLTRLVIFDPNQRITLKDALSHPFFDKVRSLEDSKSPSDIFSHSSTAATTPKTIFSGANKQPLHMKTLSLEHKRGSPPSNLLEFECVGGKELTKSRLRELFLQEIAVYRHHQKKLQQHHQAKPIARLTVTGVTFQKLSQ